MTLDLSGLSQAELRDELDKYIRLFDVAQAALLRLSASRSDADAMRRDAAETLAIIDRYPDHPLFVSATPYTR